MTRTQHVRDSISSALVRSAFRCVRTLGFAIGLKAHEVFYGYTD